MKFTEYYKKQDLKLTYGEKLLGKLVKKHKIKNTLELDLLGMIWKIEDYYNKKLK